VIVLNAAGLISSIDNGVRNTEGTGGISLKSSGAGITSGSSGIQSNGEILLSAAGDISIRDGGIRNNLGTGEVSISTTSGSISASGIGISSAGKLTLSGTGDITIQDTGISNIAGTDSVKVITTLGAITIEDNGINSKGVIVLNAAGLISSIDNGVRNTEGTGGISLKSSGAGISSGGSGIQSKGEITIESDAISLTGSVDSGTSAVNLKPVTFEMVIKLGAEDAAGILGLSATEFGLITAGKIVIGDDTKTKAIVVGASISEISGFNFAFLTQPATGALNLNDLVAVNRADMSGVANYQTAILSATESNKLAATEAINLGSGVALDILAFPSTLEIGNKILLIDNQGSAAVSGTFKDLPEGEVFEVTDGAGSVFFKINYAGGDGNDVELEVVDGTGPVITLLSPADTATEIALQPTLTMTFDEEVVLGNSGKFKLSKVTENGCDTESVLEFDLSDGDDKAAFILSENKLSISVKINVNLPVNTQVLVEIPAGFVGDLSGNDFIGFSASSYTWTFTTINKNNQTITFGVIDEKTYGDPTFTLGNAETNQGLSVSYTAEDPTVVSITGNQATILKVGSTKITATQTGDELNSAAEPVEQILNVVRKELTITATAQTKTYGEANPALIFTYTGLVNGDTKVTTEPSIATTATASSNVGTYPITLNGGKDSNYTITLVNGDLEVTQTGVTITATAQTKTYGEANPALIFTYTGLVNGDTKVTTEPSIATTATASSNVGTYPITLNGGEDSNYTITLVNGDLEVTQTGVTITATAQTKTYGEANPALTFTYTGLVNGDTKVTTEPSIATTATASSNVGTYPITLTGGEDSNYTITLVNGDLEVTQTGVTITATAQTKTYGEANPSLTFTYSGLVNGDTQVSTEPSIATTATANSNVGTYPITLNGGADANYTITLVNGTLTVGKKDLTITAADKQKVYGEANPTLTFTYTGLVNGDTKVTTEPSIATTATASSNVGTYPITLTGGEDSNYTITLVNGDLEVTQTGVTITATAQTKTYGEANPALTFTYSGLVNGDIGLTTEPSIATTATASSNVGTYPIELTGGADTNYTITLVNGTLTVGKKDLTITAADKQKVYGEANPTLTFTYTGLVNGDTKVTTEPSIATTATASSSVVTYPITLTGGSDQNYTITLVNGTLTVGKKDLTITAADKQKVYGEANPALTFTYTGLVNGDTQVTTEPSIATTATASSSVGTYPIELTGGADANYTITLVNGTLTVGKKDLTITSSDKQKVYGEANPTLTFTYSGLVNGDTQVTTEPSIATTATASSNVGTYPIELTGGADANYTITLVNGTLTVGKKDLTMTAADKQKVYGEANPTLTFTYSGLVNGDTQVTTEPSIATTATASSSVGTYPITLTGGSDQNYTITLVNGTLIVGKKDLTITAADKQKVFGTEDPAFTYTAIGLQAGDGTSILTGVLNRESGEEVGTYSILQGSLDAGANYTLVYSAGVLEIIPAKLATVINPALIQIPWSISPELPKKLNILTVDGQLVEIAVNWNSSPLNLLKRGVYTLFGALELPAGILNEADEKAVIRVEVLPKPAPLDVRLTNSMFDPSPTVFFQEVGLFVIEDPTDKIHVVSLLDAGYDNSYFEIKENILFWSSSDRAEGKTTFTIIVRVTDRDGNTLDKFFEIERKRSDINDIEVFSSFTPNGDGINDSWGVPDIRYYRGARIQVFDRSGQRLFYTEDPDVRWDGMFEGKEMPVGSYIWILESRETDEVRRGVLTLLKK
jgi:gliding motility-associated-like protein